MHSVRMVEDKRLFNSFFIFLPQYRLRKITNEQYRTFVENALICILSGRHWFSMALNYKRGDLG